MRLLGAKRCKFCSLEFILNSILHIACPYEAQGRGS